MTDSLAPTRSFDAWLTHIESLSRFPILMGLERFKVVLSRLDRQTGAKIITVGGTNGKGSTVTYLESILLAAGYRVGAYLSPHLVRFNERIRIGGEPVDDDRLIAAFEAIESVRDGLELTFFEFTTLAAWLVFTQADLDALVLEVGLGGRLDAVNGFDTDCAVITSIAIDHVDYLGHTREAIGFEKAGIFRAGKPAVIGIEAGDLPKSVARVIDERAIDARLLGRDFGVEIEAALADRQWACWVKREGGEVIYHRALPTPAIRGKLQQTNAATAIAALDCLRQSLPVTLSDIKRGLLAARLPGRFQQLSLRPAVIFDVAHNVEAAKVLAETLAETGPNQRTVALFGALGDKDIAGVVAEMAPIIDRWFVTTLPSPRSATGSELADIVTAAGGQVAAVFDEPQSAWLSALSSLSDDDRIVVFGSFVLVGDVLRRSAAVLIADVNAALQKKTAEKPIEFTPIKRRS